MDVIPNEVSVSQVLKEDMLALLDMTLFTISFYLLGFVSKITTKEIKNITRYNYCTVLWDNHNNVGQDAHIPPVIITTINNRLKPSKINSTIEVY